MTGEKATLMPILQEMLRIRYFEENLYQMYLAKKIPGMSPHLSVGQEAVAVGVCKALLKQDIMLTTHRGHGHLLARGADMKRMLAEIMGKETGYCRGRGGSMHIADVSLNIIGANGIVGGGLPIAVGAALSSLYQETGAVVVAFFGDGATSTGAFHESLNLASVLKLPVLWLCENNHYALSTKIESMLPTESIAQRAAAYGMPVWQVNGNDVLDVRARAKQAVDRARSGGGPLFIEADTYRWYGHGASDNRSYRTREEEEAWKKQCPIERLKTQLLSEGVAAQEISDMEDRTSLEVAEAIAFAEKSPLPDPTSVLDFVYSDTL